MFWKSQNCTSTFAWIILPSQSINKDKSYFTKPVPVHAQSRLVTVHVLEYSTGSCQKSTHSQIPTFLAWENSVSCSDAFVRFAILDFYVNLIGLVRELYTKWAVFLYVKERKRECRTSRDKCCPIFGGQVKNAVGRGRGGVQVVIGTQRVHAFA